MKATGIDPILNVSNLADSFAWFERLGWRKLWEWGEPPDFGAVGSGKVEIFLCQNCQGGRGRGTNKRTFSEEEQTDKTDLAPLLPEEGWMPLRQTGWWEWVEDVDAVHAVCQEQDIDITMPPANMPWNVRELHIRHPDDHVFRISQGIGCE